MNIFDRRKRTNLSKLAEGDDKSPKGCIDEEAVPIVNTINDHVDFVTTSSCSGRMSIFANCPIVPNSPNPEGAQELIGSSAARPGKGCGRWLFVSHESVDIPWETLYSDHSCPICSKNNDGDPSSDWLERLVSFKYEPFILHVEARNVEQGKLALKVALNAGYRNSGLVLSSTERVMVAVRSTARLEAPIGYVCQHQRLVLLVEELYLRMLSLKAVRMMEDNTKSMTRFLRSWNEMVHSNVTLGSKQEE